VAGESPARQHAPQLGVEEAADEQCPSNGRLAGARLSAGEDQRPALVQDCTEGVAKYRPLTLAADEVRWLGKVR
jgi:hypothetical protein